MDFFKEILNDILTLEDLILHHVGLTLITLAFIFLAFYYYILNVQLSVPPSFFFLYGIGGLVLMSYMKSKDYKFVEFSEFIGSFLSLMLGFSMLSRR
jgi:hypothetical protein